METAGCGRVGGTAGIGKHCQTIARIHCWRAAPGLIFDFGICVQVCPAVHNLDMVKAGRKQSCAVVIYQIAPAMQPT